MLQLYFKGGLLLILKVLLLFLVVVVVVVVVGDCHQVVVGFSLSFFVCFLSDSFHFL